MVLSSYFNKNLFILLLGFSLFSNTVKSQYLGGLIQVDTVIGGCLGSNAVHFRVKIFTQGDLPQLDTISLNFGNGVARKIPRQIKQPLENSQIYHEYTTTETYSCGTYVASYFDSITGFAGINAPNQNTFFLQTEFILSLANPSVSMSEIVTYPLQVANYHEDIRHCFVANIPSRDSLLFKLENFKSSGYQIPANVSLNPTTGELKMTGPNPVGVYRFVIGVKVIQPNLAYGQIFSPRTIVVDSTNSGAGITLTPSSTDSNGFDRLDIYANQLCSFKLSYADSTADSISLAVSGEPFHQQNSGSWNQSNFQDSIKGQFNWQPDLSDVRSKPYIVYSKAKSYADSSMFSNYRAIMIYVKSPPISINETSLPNLQINVIPNPTSGVIQFTPSKYQGKALSGQVYLTNAQGILVWSGTTDSQNNHIDVSPFPKGYYFIQFIDSENNIYFRKKFLKH